MSAWRTAAALGLLLASWTVAAADVVRVRGELTVLQEDWFDLGLAPRRYELTEERTGRTFRLRLPDPLAAGLTSGMVVAVRGESRGRDFVVEQAPGALEVLADVAGVSGSRRVVVLVVDFQGSAVGCSDAAIGSLLFTGARSVRGLYQESSFGNIDLEGNADGSGGSDVFRVSIGYGTGASCDPSAWAAAADSAAAAAGVVLSRYQHRLYVLPGNVSCGWAGLAELGCSTGCRVWVKTCSLADVFAHELGHNLGLGHAAIDLDDNGVSGDDEYGDLSDFMGLGGLGWRHTGGPHKAQLGWLPSSQIVVPQPGTTPLVLSPLSTDPLAAAYPQVARVARPGRNEFLYLSYRRRLGYDDGLRAEFVDRTSVHAYTGAGASPSRLLAVLGDGDRFEDSASGLVVRQLSHDATSATLSVTSACVPQVPLLEILPAVLTGAPGDALSYDVNLTNRDPGTCDASSFELDVVLPAGFGASVDGEPLLLAPGESGAATVEVVSPPGATSGATTFEVQATGPDPAQRAAATATYVVDDDPPAVVSGLRATWRPKGWVELSWDGVAEAVRYRVLRDGVPIGEASEPRLTDRGPRPGSTHAYRVVALDGAGNASAPSSPVTLAIPQADRSTRR